MRHYVLLSLVLAACTRAGDPPSAEQPSQPPAVAPIPKTTAAPKPAAATRVELSSVTLADDCGGISPYSPPAKTAVTVDEDSASKAKSKQKRDSQSAPSLAKRRCEQTSMQLNIFAGDASSLRVKSVELFDEAGKSLGTLTASKPTRWSSTTMTYEGWDEAFTAGAESNVSYVLSQPKWDHIADRWNKTYTLKTVLSVGGIDQTAQKDVTLTAPTSLPPNVKT
jgi:hypothetical protein